MFHKNTNVHGYSYMHQFSSTFTVQNTYTRMARIARAFSLIRIRLGLFAGIDCNQKMDPLNCIVNAITARSYELTCAAWCLGVWWYGTTHLPAARHRAISCPRFNLMCMVSRTSWTIQYCLSPSRVGGVKRVGCWREITCEGAPV